MSEGLYVENKYNDYMKGGQPNLGVVDSPNKLPKYDFPKLLDIDKLYPQVEKDIYTGTKKADPPKRKGFPKILKLLGLGIPSCAGILYLAKKIIPKIRK